MLDMSRTTTIIGELIQLITDMEEVTTNLGKEGFAYYKAGLFYDDLTLDMCRRIEGALQQFEKSKREMQEGLEDNLLLGNEKPGPFTRLRKALFGTLMHRETSAHERALREVYDELAGRIQGLANQDPRALSAKMLKMCKTVRRLQADIDSRWGELETRVKNERKGPMFILILNMFVVNFFKFSNQQWFRHWIARFQAFQDRIGERLHREVVHDLSVEEETPSKSETPPARGPERAPAFSRSFDLGDQDDDESDPADLEPSRGRRRSPFPDDDVNDRPSGDRHEAGPAPRPFVPKAGPAAAAEDQYVFGYEASPSFPEEPSTWRDDEEPPRRTEPERPHTGDGAPPRRDAGSSGPPILPRREPPVPPRREAEPAGPPRRDAGPPPRRDSEPAGPPRRDAGPPPRRDSEPAGPPRRDAGPPPRREAEPSGPPSPPRREPAAPPRREAEPVKRPTSLPAPRKVVPPPQREEPLAPMRSLFDEVMDDDPAPPTRTPASEPIQIRPAEPPSGRAQIIPRPQRRPDVIQLPKRSDSPPPPSRRPLDRDLDADD